MCVVLGDNWVDCQDISDWLLEFGRDWIEWIVEVMTIRVGYKDYKENIRSAL